jgi:hypothetical protein
MAVKLTSGGKLLFPLTSPPPKPEPSPNAELIAKVMDYGDREVVVTIPFPDSIELVAGVTNEIVAGPDQSGKSAKTIYHALDEAIKEYLVEITTGLPAFVTGQVNPNKLTRGTFYIAYDDAQPLNKARLTLWSTKGSDFASWKVKLEFSPSKAGPKGLAKLTDGLEAVLPFLDIKELIKAFTVGRIDCAIDCIGVWPLDLIAHIPLPGKRMVYVGDQGRPESVYFYQRKKPRKKPPHSLSVKTVGPHRLTLYERRDYHLQLCLKPPYGPSPVTRAEVTKRWTKKRPALADLSAITNLFKGRRVAYASAVPAEDKKSWRRFCLAAFGGGVDSSLSNWFPGPGFGFYKAYQECAGDLIDQDSWVQWDAGLKLTGLEQWINPSGQA